MAGVEELYLSIKTDIKNATKDVTEYVKGLKETKKETKEAGDATKKLTKEQEALQTSLLEDIKSFQVMGVSLGGIQKGFAKIIPTAKLAFSTITKGIMATGVGALVIAFTALVTWFTKTKVGAEALAKVFAGVGAAVNVIVDRITGMVEAVRQMFSGDIMGGLKSLGSQFTGIGAEMSKEIDLAIKLKAQLQALVDSERELSVETAKRRAEVEDLKLIAEDVTKTEEERLEAAEKAFALENELLDKRVANAEQAVRIQQEQMAMSKNMEADLQKLADLEINLANIRQESTTKQIELNNKINAIKAQQEAEEKAAQERFIRRQNERVRAQNATIQTFNKMYKEEALHALADERARENTQNLWKRKEREKLIEDTVFDEKKKEKLITDNFTFYETEKQRINKKFDDMEKEQAQAQIDALSALQNEVLLLKIEDAKTLRDKELELQQEADIKAIGEVENREQQIAAIKEKYRLINEKNADADAEEEKRRDKAVRDAKIGMARSGLSLIGAIAGEGSAIAKGVALADATITGIQGVQNAYTTAQKSPLTVLFPGYPIVQAGLAGAFSALQIQKILSSNPKGDASGASVSTPASGAPSGQFMGGGFELGEMEPPEAIKAFVVTDEMTSSQNQLANIRRRSTI